MWLAAWLLAACGGGAPTEADSCRTRACATACLTSEGCTGGRLCNGGLCESQPVTLWAFAACALDADCPRGDHCALGACQHECLSDAQCPAGEICDARGSCAVPSGAGQPAALSVPVAGGPALAVDPPLAEFATPGARPLLRLANTGGQPLDFRLASDARWLDAEPRAGRIAAGASAAVTLAIVDASQAAASPGATLSVFSSGGSASIAVRAPARLDGTYVGAVVVSAPGSLGTFPFGLSLAEQTDGTVSGTVAAERSPAHAVRVAVAGSRGADGLYTLTASLPAGPGGAANPDLGAPLRRQLSLSVRLEGPRLLSGAFAEVVEGLLGRPVTVEGTVKLTRVGAASPLPPVAPAPVVLADPATPPAPAGCDACPAGPCPADAVAAGRAFLEGAFPMYEAFRTSSSGYATIQACIASPYLCVNTRHLECAQYHFGQALGTDPGCSRGAVSVPGCASRGLLDTFKGFAHWRALQANELAAQAFRWGQELTAVETQLAASRPAVLAGITTDRTSAAAVRAIADAYHLRWLDALPLERLQGTGETLLPEQLAFGTVAASYQRGDCSDLVRPLRLLALHARLARQQAEARHRLDWAVGDATAAGLVAQRATASSWILGAGLAAVLQRLGKQALVPEALAREVTELAGAADAMAQGASPAGVPEGQILYLYTPGQSGATNFEQIAAFTSQTFLGLARTDEQKATQATRDFEVDQARFQQELVAQVDALDDQLFRICGGSASAPDLLHCGSTSGEVYEAMQELRAAGLRIQQAQDAVNRLYGSVAVEQNRAARIAGIDNAVAQMIAEDGRREEVLSQRQSDLERMQIVANGVASALSSWGSGIAGGLLGSAAAAIQTGTALRVSEGMEQINAERIRMQTLQRVRIELAGRDKALVDSEARVKTTLLDIPGLKINAELAGIDAARASARLQAAVANAVNVLADRQRNVDLQGTDPRVDPLYRASRDATVLRAQRSFRAAQKWVHLTVRAWEYEVNASYGERGQLFRLNTAADLESFLTTLQGAFLVERARIRQPQLRTTTVSLRRDVLGFREALVDAATGVRYEPVDLFRRYVADPRHRDAQGNLRIELGFSIGPDSPVFATTDCNDRLVGVRASFVGAQLGTSQPYLDVLQRGTGYLRSCLERDPATLEPVVNAYDLPNTLGEVRARLQAGVNLSGPADPAAPPENLELYGRPVAAEWVLVVDQQGQPSNRTLRLENLDDVVLFLTHQTQTIQ